MPDRDFGTNSTLGVSGRELPVTHGAEADEINLLDYWRVIIKCRRMIALIVITASVAAVVISLTMTNYFRAQATLIPVSGKGGMPSVVSQLGGLASLAGVSVPGGMTETDKFMAILKSRTLAEKVIVNENLMPVLFEDIWDSNTGKWKGDDPKKQPTLEKAVNILKGLMLIDDDKKTKTITISGIARDPATAARIVNAYIRELQGFIGGNAFTMSKRNRIFIEGQLEKNKLELLEASKEVNNFYKGKGESGSDTIMDVQIGPVIRPVGILSDGTVKEALGAEAVPDVASTEMPSALDPGALPTIASQQVIIEKKIAEAKVVKNVPHQVYLTYLMLRRDLLGKVNALLTTQYEMAKIEESKEDLAFQVIDRAVPPEMKFKPVRSQICIMTFIIALLVSSLLAFFLEYIKKMQNQVKRT